MEMGHDDIIKLKHFPHYWSFVRGIHWSLVNSTHKGQWHGALMFSLICTWTNGWVNNWCAGDLRCHCAHYYVTVMEAAVLLCHICILLLHTQYGTKLIFTSEYQPWIMTSHHPAFTTQWVKHIFNIFIYISWCLIQWSLGLVVVIVKV